LARLPANLLVVGEDPSIELAQMSAKIPPKQHSSGGKSRLGSITKRGDAYLRTLLILGARSVLNTAMRHKDRISRWVLALQTRRGYHRALVAIANKNARIAWALLSRNQELRTA